MNAEFIDHHYSPNYTLGETQFMDLSYEEFLAMYTGFSGQQNAYPEVALMGSAYNEPEVDWRHALPPVKNQGQCGSCWAFATVGSLEGLHFIKTGELEVFSEQSIVDCSHNQNYGCNGGMPDRALQYTSEHGVPLSQDYPYKGRNGTCREFNSAYKNAGYVNVPQNSPEQMMTAVN